MSSDMLYIGVTVIVLTGYPASGKTTCASILGDLGLPCVSMGDGVRDSVGSYSESEVWEEAQRLRDVHGDHGVAVPCIPHLRKSLDEHGTVVLEGSRNTAEVEYVEDELDADTFVIWVSAYFEDRVRWFSDREGRGQSLEVLIDRTLRERNAGMGRYFDESDHIINNHSSKSHLFHELSTVLEDEI